MKNTEQIEYLNRFLYCAEEDFADNYQPNRQFIITPKLEKIKNF